MRQVRRRSAGVGLDLGTTTDRWVPGEKVGDLTGRVIQALRQGADWRIILLALTWGGLGFIISAVVQGVATGVTEYHFRRITGAPGASSSNGAWC